MSKTRRSAELEFMCGVGLVIAALAREHDEPSQAYDICKCNGFTLDDFKGIDSFDLKPIRKMFKEESRPNAFSGETNGG